MAFGSLEISCDLSMFDSRRFFEIACTITFTATTIVTDGEVVPTLVRKLPNILEPDGSLTLFQPQLSVMICSQEGHLQLRDS